MKGEWLRKYTRNGILVKAAVTLRCESSECISERYFRVMPKELDEEHKMIREIENYLKKQSADPGDSIKLPEQLNGKKLIWNTKKNIYLKNSVPWRGNSNHPSFCGAIA